MDRAETQSLERGLAVLECLTTADALTAAEVAVRTHLSTPTVRRLLNTLHAAGYVSQSRSHQPYRLTAKIASLAARLPASVHLRDATQKAIAAIGQTYPWPIAFIQWDGTHLVVKETTTKRPQLEPTQYMVGWRLKPPFGAAAFVIAAQSPPQVRQAVMWQYRTSKLQKAKTQLGAFEAALSGTALRRAASFVLQSPGRAEHSVAVPVTIAGVCVGALETRVISNAISGTSDKQKVINTLSKCAVQIALSMKQFA